MRHFLNPKPVVELASMVEGQWRRRLKVAYLVDIPRSFERFISLFLRMLKQSTREKVRFITSVEELIVELERSGCDEETVATARSALESRRKRGAKQTWFPLVDHSFFREALADLNLSQDLESFTEMHHRRFRDAISLFRMKRWGHPCSATSTGDANLRAQTATTTRHDSNKAPATCGPESLVQEPIKRTPLPQARASSRVTFAQEVAPPAGSWRWPESKRPQRRSRLAVLARCLVCGACGK